MSSKQPFQHSRLTICKEDINTCSSGYAEKTLGLKKFFDLFQIVNDAIDHITLRIQFPQLRPSVAFIVKGFPFGHATSTSDETAKQDWNRQCGNYRFDQTVGTWEEILVIDWSLGTTIGKFPYGWNKCIYWFVSKRFSTCQTVMLTRKFQNRIIMPN